MLANRLKQFVDFYSIQQPPTMHACCSLVCDVIIKMLGFVLPTHSSSWVGWWLLVLPGSSRLEFSSRVMFSFPFSADMT
jgi:hypothetical protein